MKQVQYATTTIKEGNRLEILTPTLEVGEAVEVIVIVAEHSPSRSVSDSNLSCIDRREFMKLPMEERREILAQQAEDIAEHYEQDTEWREWLSFDTQEFQS